MCDYCKEPSDESIVWGRKIPEDMKVTMMADISVNNDLILVEGEIIELRDERKLASGIVQKDMLLSDFNSTIVCRIRYPKDFTLTVSILKGKTIKVLGNIKKFSETGDVLMMVNDINIGTLKKREDKASRKRIELHAYSSHSGFNAVADVRKYAAQVEQFGHSAAALTDQSVVRGFIEFAAASKRFDIKPIYGMEGFLIDESRDAMKRQSSCASLYTPFRIMILVASQIGLKNLYQLVTLSRTEKGNGPALITRSELITYREGLIFGSASYEGELAKAIAEGRDDESLEKIAAFYDYIEIHPVMPNFSLGIANINRQIYNLGKKSGKPVCAVSNVHYLNPEDEILVRILTENISGRRANDTGGLYYRTTNEMLEAFSYLGEAQALEVVVENPEKIAAMIGKIVLLPRKYNHVDIDGAFERIRLIALEKAQIIYGNPLPAEVKTRLDKELGFILEFGQATRYLLAHELTKESIERGFPFGFLGSYGSSLVAFFLNAAGTNPLPPHYYCGNEKCRYSEFFVNSPLNSGFDLEDKHCPRCGSKLKKDGHKLPIEVFLGFEGDKIPDIDLDFLPEVQPEIIKKMREIFGQDNIICIGENSTISYKTAKSLVEKYCNGKSLKIRPAEVRRLANTLKQTGSGKLKVCESGFFIAPPDLDIIEFSPLDVTAPQRKIKYTVPHFDYNDIDCAFWKQDIRTDDKLLQMIDLLCKSTDVSPNSITYDDPKTLSLFSSLESLNIREEDIGGIKVGTLGIDGFGAPFVMNMLNEMRPKTFGDLVHIFGLFLGTKTWSGNAEKILKTEDTRLSQVISTRDDIINYLMEKGLSARFSFDVMERVRRGKGLKSEMVEEMGRKNIPRWFIESCDKIQYIFPKAHVVHFTMEAFKIAYFKVHHPLAFYAAYFAVNKPSSSLIKVALKGRKNILEMMEMATKNNSKSQSEAYYYPALMLEYLARGFKLYLSDRKDSVRGKFFMKNFDGILFPAVL